MIAVFFGAFLHASWNALVRGSPDRTQGTTLIAVGAGAITVCWLPFAHLPAVASWPYLAASVVIHVAYFALVAFSYRKGELSFVYPIMRGIAPAFSAIAAALLLSEWPSPWGWLGVLLVCCGIVLLAVDSVRSQSFHALSALFALANAGVIVVYTLVDGVGARLSGHPLSYTGWMLLLTALPLLALSAGGDGANAIRYMQRHWARGLAGGACAFGSYGLALWAMTRAPIALVAALRETSVVFAMILAATFLRERITSARIVSVLIVTAGAVAIKVS
jgi:drug/metabolite transporter (DMT)-like permease